MPAGIFSRTFLPESCIEESIVANLSYVVSLRIVLSSSLNWSISVLACERSSLEFSVTDSPGIGTVENLPLTCPKISFVSAKANLRIHCLPMALMFSYGMFSNGRVFRLLTPSAPLSIPGWLSQGSYWLLIVNWTQNFSGEVLSGVGKILSFRSWLGNRRCQ